MSRACNEEKQVTSEWNNTMETSLRNYILVTKFIVESTCTEYLTLIYNMKGWICLWPIRLHNARDAHMCKAKTVQVLYNVSFKDNSIVVILRFEHTMADVCHIASLFMHLPLWEHSVVLGDWHCLPPAA